MKTGREALDELIGEHEAIMAQMHSLTKSADGLTAQPAGDRERVSNYRCRLYDFRDALWSHLEVDERIFKSVLGDVYFVNPIEEHQEIQRLVNDMILLADNAVTENLGLEELKLYCESLGNAFKKICNMVELHIAKENTILGRVQKALDHQQV